MISVSSNDWFILPERVELRARLLGGEFHAERFRRSRQEDLNFIDQHIIPRLFAEAIAFLALCEAAGNLALSATHIALLPFFLLFSQVSTCHEIFEQARKQILYAYADATIGIGLLYGLFYPEGVLEAATPKVSEQQPQEAVEEEPQEASGECSPVNSCAEMELEEPSLPTFHFDETTAEQDVYRARLPDREAYHNPIPLAGPYLNIEFPVIHGEEDLTEQMNMIIPEEPILPPPAPAAEIFVATAIFSSPAQVIVADVAAPQAIDPPPKQGAVAHTFQATPSGLEPVEQQKKTVTVDPYDQLLVPVEGAAAIGRMITTLATTSLPGLLFERNNLKAMGEEIKKHDIHTLKFLQCILGNPTLRQHLRKIHKSTLKWEGLLWSDGKKGGEDGTGGGLNRLSKTGALDPLLPGFCKALGADLTKVRAFASERDWDGMLVYLMSSGASANNHKDRSQKE